MLNIGADPTKLSLEDQIRAKWGQYGDWKAADQDQVAALATMLRKNGIEDLSQFKLKAREYDIPGRVQEGPNGDVRELGRQGTAFDAYYGDKQIGFLGDINRDGRIDVRDSREVVLRACQAPNCFSRTYACLHPPCWVN